MFTAKRIRVQLRAVLLETEVNCVPTFTLNIQEPIAIYEACCDPTFTCSYRDFFFGMTLFPVGNWTELQRDFP
jgi:hypothetical protein